MTMSNSSYTNGERGDNGTSWFNRLAANLGFASADARATIALALQEDDGGSLTPRERTCCSACCSSGSCGWKT